MTVSSFDGVLPEFGVFQLFMNNFFQNHYRFCILIYIYFVFSQARVKPGFHHITAILAIVAITVSICNDCYDRNDRCDRYDYMKTYDPTIARVVSI